MNQPNSQNDERYFQPGQRLHLRPEWKRKAEPLYAQARVSAPGRLHFCVFDFSKMAPGLGGGGLGISTNTAGNEIVVSVGKSGAQGDLAPSGQHLLELFKQAVGYGKDDISIVVPERIAHFHGGFGSNVTFNTAVMAGLNAVFGSPFSVQEILGSADPELHRERRRREERVPRARHRRRRGLHAVRRPGVDRRGARLR